MFKCNRWIALILTCLVLINTSNTVAYGNEEQNTFNEAADSMNIDDIVIDANLQNDISNNIIYRKVYDSTNSINPNCR